MKIMGWWLRFKYSLGYETQPEQVIRRVWEMDHEQLATLHRIFGQETYQRGTPADIQSRHIAKELLRRGDANGQHRPLLMRTFVKGAA